MAEQVQAEVFEAILASVREGLSLRQAASLQDVPHARVASWVVYADRGVAPWAEFLLALTKQDAALRGQVLGDLREIAKVDNAARRDLCRQLGAASPLERELDLLRRMDGFPDEGSGEDGGPFEAFRPPGNSKPWDPEL